MFCSLAGHYGWTVQTAYQPAGLPPPRKEKFLIRLLRGDVAMDAIFLRVGRYPRRWRFDGGLIELRDHDDGERAWQEHLCKRHGLLRRISRIDQLETRARMSNEQLREFLLTTGVRCVEPPPS